MPIQWFPGHMHKASQQIVEILPSIDLVIEVLDARLPWSSQNPLLAEIAGQKPGLKLINKADLADEALSDEWLTAIRAESGRDALLSGPDTQNLAGRLIEHSHALLGARSHRAPPVALITGIPNAGKSTLINRIAGRKIAHTGDEAAVTRSQQRVRLDDGFTLIDTPGMLWHRVHNEASGYRLALSGAIRDSALDHVDVAMNGASALAGRYPARLRERYQLDALPDDPVELLEAIGVRRGALGRRGHIDLDKAAKAFIDDYRTGRLGRTTLETPAMVAAETRETAEREAERAAKKAERQARRKAKRR